MITKQQHNEAIRKARRERAQGVRDKYLDYGVRNTRMYKPAYKEFSDEDRRSIREQVRKDYRKYRRRSIAVFAGTIILLALICLLILYYR